MTSIHLFQAEKKDFQDVYDLLIQFKHDDLEHLDLPKVDQKKLTIGLEAAQPHPRPWRGQHANSV